MRNIDPRPPINQGIDINNELVIKHNELYQSLLTTVSGTSQSRDLTLFVNPYGTAPLSGYVGLYLGSAVDLINIEITNSEGATPVQYQMTPDKAGANLFPLLGLVPDAVNYVTVSITSNTFPTQEIKTGSLPPTDSNNTGASSRFPWYGGFPEISLTKATTNSPENLSNLYFVACFTRYNIGVDHEGIVRWYTTHEIPAYNFQRIENGHFLSTANNFDDNKIMYEFDMVGRVHRVINLDNQCHHAIYPLSSNRILINSEYTGETVEDGLSIVDIDTGLETAYFDMRDVMDVNRIPRPRNVEEKDWLHINQAYFDSANNLIVVSARHQGVFAVNADTNELVFILANHQGWNDEYKKYLLTPIDDNGNPLYNLDDPRDAEKADKEFWQWGQHAVEQISFRQGYADFMVFDNGNWRSRNDTTSILPNDNYSRIIRYRVDLSAMTVSIVFEYGRTEVGSRGYSSYVCNQQQLNDGNYFINFGGVIFDDKIRRASIYPGYSDLPDPRYTDRRQGMILLQEINPSTKGLISEITITSGTYKTPADDEDEYYFDMFAFRAHKLKMVP